MLASAMPWRENEHKNERLKSIEIRKDLTDEWKRRGLKEGIQFATLTDVIYHTWAGMPLGNTRSSKD